MSVYHTPAMLAEVLDGLALEPGQRIVDATLGGGGHAEAIAARIAPGGVLLGLDQDAEAIESAGERLRKTVPNTISMRLRQTNFESLVGALEAEGLTSVDGFLFDLGVSSHQLNTARRGFAFRYKGPLDMRMRADQGETAADLLNRLPEAEIARILFEFGEESRGRRIAEEIVRRRATKPLVTTEDLVDAVRGAMPFRTRPGEIHPATKTFQAVRIAVNRELDVLATAIRSAANLLNPGGRIVVISYHSLEDRIVKTVFGELAGRAVGNDLPAMPSFRPTPSLLTIITKKPIGPSVSEVRNNPRARSAKLRTAERTKIDDTILEELPL